MWRSTISGMVSVAEIKIFHRWASDDRVRPDGIAAQRHGRHVDLRIVIRQRIEARVIAERSLEHELFPWVDVTLDDDFRFGRHFEV